MYLKMASILANIFSRFNSHLLKGLGFGFNYVMILPLRLILLPD